MIFCHKNKKIEDCIAYSNDCFFLWKKCLTNNFVKDMIEKKLGMVIIFIDNEVPDENSAYNGQKKKTGFEYI